MDRPLNTIQLVDSKNPMESYEIFPRYLDLIIVIRVEGACIDQGIGEREMQFVIRFSRNYPTGTEGDP